MERALRILTRIPPGAIVAVAAIAGLWVLSGTPTAAERVPDLVGLEVNAATAAATEDGFASQVRFTEGGGVAGTVVGQVPEADEIRNKGTTVTLTVTRGAFQVVVPNVAGMPADQARDTLERAHLTPGPVVYRDEPGAEPGRVITTEPAPDTSVDAQTEVSIIVAS